MESQPASPAGSPGGGSQNPQVDGAELHARRMLLATEAASSAATVAAKALEELKSSNEKGDRSWYKLIQKPAGSFNPDAREQEISQWKEWAWSFEQYLSNIDPLFAEDIKVLRGNPTNAVDTSVQHDDEKKRGALLYSFWHPWSSRDL